jgi:hypothetical protein
VEQQRWQPGDGAIRAYTENLKKYPLGEALKSLCSEPAISYTDTNTFSIERKQQ